MESFLGIAVILTVIIMIVTLFINGRFVLRNLFPAPLLGFGISLLTLPGYNFGIIRFWGLIIIVGSGVLWGNLNKAQPKNEEEA